MSNHCTHPVGSIGWTEHTGGVLTRREGLSLAGPLIRDELCITAGLLAMALRGHPGRRNDVDPASLTPRARRSPGMPRRLPNIHHRKEYEATRTDELPDYRITCIFVDRDYRRKGVAGVALRGAIDLITKAGGGVVEGYPQDTQGKKVGASFLYNTTRSLYEQTGFTYDRPKGKNHCVMRRTVSA
jgi:GNAT superfamily N-acetyltransferase